MLGGVVLGEVSVTHWRAIRGVDAMIEKSRSAVSLRRSKASFKARNEFGWSVERGTVDVQLEDSPPNFSCCHWRRCRCRVDPSRNTH